MRLSIRNQLPGEVVDIHRGPVTTSVKVRLDGGDQVVTSSITSESADGLELEVGKRVTVLVKASSVSLGVDD